MTTRFITRHKGAERWAAGEGISAQAVAHLDINSVQQGDVVIGTLRWHWQRKFAHAVSLRAFDAGYTRSHAWQRAERGTNA
jgi:putative CRISPR-associated protein (TIGR02620 family)